MKRKACDRSQTLHNIIKRTCSGHFRTHTSPGRKDLRTSSYHLITPCEIITELALISLELDIKVTSLKEPLLIIFSKTISGTVSDNLLTSSLLGEIIYGS